MLRNGIEKFGTAKMQEIKKICKLRQNMVEILSLMIEVIEKDENSLNYIKDKLISLKETLIFENKENLKWGIDFIKETLKRRIELLKNKK